MIRPIPMYLWLRWRLGHGEFKEYGPANKAVRPALPYGGKGQYPVPKSWWDKLKTYLPVQPAPIPFSWDTVGYWTAWGWGNGQFVDSAKVKAGTVTADDLRPTILKLQARGAKWVGVQDLVATRGMRDALKLVCKQQGLKLVVWARPYEPTKLPYFEELLDYWTPDAYAVNVEDAGDWTQFASKLAERNPLPRAVWTNFPGAGAMPDGTYSIPQAQVWWGNGYACITEAYVNDNPQATPANLDWVARAKLGYSEVYPSIGVYGGWTVEAYEQMLYPFPSFSVYLVEYLPEFP